MKFLKPIGQRATKGMDPNRADEIIKKIRSKDEVNGKNFFRRFSDLDHQLMELGEAIRGLRAIKARRILTRIHELSESLYGDLRDSGRLGTTMIISSRLRKKGVFIKSSTRVERIPLAY